MPDGLGHPLRHGAARDRPLRRRAADRQGLYADRVRRAAAAAGARRARAPGEGTDHRHLHRAGRRRRPQRADRRRGARHPRRPYRDGARDRRARPLSGDQRAEIGVAHHAALGRPGLPAGHHARPPGDGDLCRHGGADPARRLPARDRAPRSTRRSRCTRRSRPSWRQGKDEATGLAEGYQRLAQILGPRWKPKTNVMLPASRVESRVRRAPAAVRSARRTSTVAASGSTSR